MQPKAVRCRYLGPAQSHPRDAMRILCKSGRAVATRHVTWAFVPTPNPSTPQKAILAPRERENSSGGDGSEEGQAPSPVVTSTSSEDDESGGEGHSGGDGTDDVLVYDGVGFDDGLDDLDGTPQKTEKHRQQYQAPLRAFNAKRANWQGSVVETNSGGVFDAPSGGEVGNSLRSSNRGDGSGGNDSANNTVGSGTSLR